ncbi:MAG: hypothetical protein GX804_09465, partial [Lentisphaerae bacterium]|nr:hypothetical protein [Lentisphaerota bacterium]
RSFYTGDVWVEAVSNAEESGYVPGIFKISRDSADSATTFDLQVDYAVSGTAEVGKNYQEMSGTVTIPAGMESVEVEVVPVVDVQSREVTTIVLAILPTAYYTNHLASASLDIEKIQLPEGKNVWIAPEDGKASDASNWSLGRIPTETDTILLDWYSTAAMTWDADTSEELPDTVANWIQTEEYDNTVTFNTYKTGSFKAFTVTGDATLSGGSWKHRRDAGSRQNSPAGLFLVVEGDLVTEENFTFDGLGAGYGNQRGPSGTTHAFVGVSHGGQGGYSSEGPCYGSYLYPDDLGSTSTSTSTGNPGGGGLFNIVVNGTFTHDGTITVKGASAHSYCSHAGGSVYISAGSLLGTGIIDADCGVQAGKRPTGGGGRIAIYTDAESYSEFTNSFKGTITAASGMTTGPQTNAGEMQAFGANGTIYIASLDEDGERTMRLYNRGLAQTSRVDDYYKAAVIRSGETWELDKLILEQTGRVAVSSDGVLSLPSSDSIISDGHANNMVCLDGGSIEFTADGAENLLVADGFSIGVKSDTTLVQGIDINETWNLMFIADDMILAVDRLFNEKRCIPAGEYIVEEINDWADAAVATGEGTVIVLRDQAGTVLRIR